MPFRCTLKNEPLKKTDQKQKIPHKINPLQNHNQVKKKEPLARCKSMNTTPT